MSPSVIPCRMCQAGPGEPCKYKGEEVTRALGGHARRTPARYRRFHYKRVDDARCIAR